MKINQKFVTTDCKREVCCGCGADPFETCIGYFNVPVNDEEVLMCICCYNSYQKGNHPAQWMKDSKYKHLNDARNEMYGDNIDELS